MQNREKIYVKENNHTRQYLYDSKKFAYKASEKII